jgi:hypothetical protein
VSWAKRAKKDLASGKRTVIKPKGNSMEPIVVSGATVTLDPIKDPKAVKKGDVVLCKVRGSDYLHLVHATRYGTQWLIGNNKGRTNGWVGAHAIYGKAVKIDNG